MLGDRDENRECFESSTGVLEDDEAKMRVPVHLELRFPVYRVVTQAIGEVGNETISKVVSNWLTKYIAEHRGELADAGIPQDVINLAICPAAVV